MKKQNQLMKFFTIITFMLIAISIIILLCSCEYTAPTVNGTKADIANQIEIADDLSNSQATPTDIDYSLERYNLIRRTYWVNGQREKANSIPCSVEKPFGYIVLFSGNTIVGNFVVDGKVSSLNSYLTPNYAHVKESYDGYYDIFDKELADVDGSYGENDAGIFFFTPDGKYIEWTGTYLYSDIPFIVENPVVKYEGE